MRIATSNEHSVREQMPVILSVRLSFPGALHSSLTGDNSVSGLVSELLGNQGVHACMHGPGRLPVTVPGLSVCICAAAEHSVWREDGGVLGGSRLWGGDTSIGFYSERKAMNGRSG